MRYLLCTLLFLGAAASAVTFQGTVVGVHDGDTFTLLTEDHRQKKIRLRHVDAPETNQPFASRSKQALSLLVYGKTVRAVCPYRSYNRYVCDVTVAGRDVQAELVKAGMVWVSKKYNKRPELWTYLQRAEAQKKGIWSLPAAQRISPRDWRRRHKGKAGKKPLEERHQ